MFLLPHGEGREKIPEVVVPIGRLVRVRPDAIEERSARLADIVRKIIAIEHVDAVVILERPKLGPHFPKMREALAKSLGVTPETIHLKAKTNEGVDAVGRGEAIACHVAATLVAL